MLKTHFHKHLHITAFLVILQHYNYEVYAHLNHFKTERQISSIHTNHAYTGNGNTWQPYTKHSSSSSPFPHQLKKTHQYPAIFNTGNDNTNSESIKLIPRTTPTAESEQMTIIKPYMFAMSNMHHRSSEADLLNRHSVILPHVVNNRKIRRRYSDTNHKSDNVSAKNKQDVQWNLMNKGDVFNKHKQHPEDQAYLGQSVSHKKKILLEPEGQETAAGKMTLPDTENFKANTLDIENSDRDYSDDDDNDVNDEDFKFNGDNVGDDIDEENLNALLVPLENFFNKLKQFCDIAENVINDRNFLYESEHNKSPSSASVPLKTVASTSRKILSAEVDGGVNIKGHQLSPWLWPFTNTTTSTKDDINNAAMPIQKFSSAIGTGRGKKVKRKFRKFLLPLLIAYKLKFMALIPVLIGGLTLLVGTTGLAGFFFALFTAVMSLKSTGGGTKSIIVKKI